MRRGQKGSRCDWVGETPWCQKFTCKNSPLPPRFLICIHSLSSPSALCLLNLSPSLVLSFCLPSFLPHYLPASSSLSFGVSYHPALLYLHCGAALTIRMHSHTHRETHTHHFRQPPPSLTPLHCRHETFYNPWCASSSSRDSATTTSNQYSAFTHNVASCLYPI